jgi:hypothetical protein
MSIESIPDPRDRAARDAERDAADDLAEIRYSLTALGEAMVSDRARTRFRGFGPCPVAKIGIAG